MPPTEKLQRVWEMNRVVGALAVARIRARHGSEISQHELNLRLAALHMDRQTLVKACGWDPAENPRS